MFHFLDSGLEDIEFSVELLRRALAVVSDSLVENAPNLFKAVKLLSRMKLMPGSMEYIFSFLFPLYS